MQFSKNTSSRSSKSLLIKGIFILIFVISAIALLGKIEFPSPNKDIEKILVDRNKLIAQTNKLNTKTKIQEEVIKTNMQEYFSRIPFEENLLYFSSLILDNKKLKFDLRASGKFEMLLHDLEES